MILTRQSIEMGPEGYIEIDMDGDDELIDAMTYDNGSHNQKQPAKLQTIRTFDGRSFSRSGRPVKLRRRRINTA